MRGQQPRSGLEKREKQPNSSAATLAKMARCRHRPGGDIGAQCGWQRQAGNRGTQCRETDAFFGAGEVDFRMRCRMPPQFLSDGFSTTACPPEATLSILVSTT